MERLILDKLRGWKVSRHRKPLFLEGARKVGKTWVLQEFGRQHYENTAYFNFAEHEWYKQFFETSLNIKRLLQNLMMASGQKIEEDKTLIIFDDVDDCPRVITSLKYFCENAPQYHVVCASSRTGVAVGRGSSRSAAGTKRSAAGGGTFAVGSGYADGGSSAVGSGFPVGKVDFMRMGPMSFTEFLLANGDWNLAEYLQTVDTLDPVMNVFAVPLYEKLKMYLVTGGMPEAVCRWTEDRDVDAMQAALALVCEAYEQDFTLHADVYDAPKIARIWQSLSTLLARPNKKFTYKAVKAGARAREYEMALQWLVDAHMVQLVHRCVCPSLPIAAFDEHAAFKAFPVDVGMLRHLLELSPTAFGEGNRLFTEFNGALTQSYVLQTLSSLFEVQPRYWSQSNPPYEVEFMIQKENDIFPIEVKGEFNAKSRGLRKFKEVFPDKVKLSILFSLDNLKLEDDVLNIPLYMIEHTDRLIDLALHQQHAAIPS